MKSLVFFAEKKNEEEHDLSRVRLSPHMQHNDLGNGVGKGIKKPRSRAVTQVGKGGGGARSFTRSAAAAAGEGDGDAVVLNNPRPTLLSSLCVLLCRRLLWHQKCEDHHRRLGLGLVAGHRSADVSWKAGESCQMAREGGRAREKRNDSLQNTETAV